MKKEQQCFDIICTIKKIFNFYLSSERFQNDCFGEEDSYHEKKIQLLKCIIDNPNKTITEIAEETSRTKSAVSQIVKKLVEKGLIEVEKDNLDKRKLVFIPTEKGVRVNSANRKYNIKMAKFLSKFLEDYTEKDIELFLKLLDRYNEFQKLEYSLKDRCNGS